MTSSKKSSLTPSNSAKFITWGGNLIASLTWATKAKKEKQK